MTKIVAGGLTIDGENTSKVNAGETATVCVQTSITNLVDGELKSVFFDVSLMIGGQEIASAQGITPDDPTICGDVSLPEGSHQVKVEGDIGDRFRSTDVGEITSIVKPQQAIIEANEFLARVNGAKLRYSIENPNNRGVLVTVEHTFDGVTQGEEQISLRANESVERSFSVTVDIQRDKRVELCANHIETTAFDIPDRIR